MGVEHVQHLENAMKLKEEGNDFYKNNNFEEAVKLYTDAIKLCPEESIERSVCLKNRAAALLKLSQYEAVVNDTTSALEITPNDPKALFRRCQALESLDRFEEAYRDATSVLKNDPTNTTIQPFLSRLYKIVQKRNEENALTTNKATKMVNLAFDMAEEKEKRETAFNNLIVLAREQAGAEILWSNGVVTQIVRLLKHEQSDVLCVSGVRVLGELMRNRTAWTKRCLQQVGVPWFLELLNNNCDERVNAVQSCLQTVINSLSGLTNKADSKPDQLLCDENKSEIDTILTCLVFSSTSRTMTGKGRDAIIELITQNVDYTAINWAERMVEIRGVYRMMEIASELKEYKYESAMEITNNTKNIVAVCLSRIYDNMYYDQARERFIKGAEEYVKEQLLNPQIEGKVRAIVAITTLLNGPLDAGNQLIAKEGIMEMILVMAGTDDVLQQKVACECIIATSSKKDKVTAIVQQGADILKKLYMSKDDSVRVRALVGLCKLGSSGGTDASVRPFADGASQKLAHACRKFLINPSKDRDMRKWAAEGLSYLTLDAEVKEKLIEDKAAIRALIELAKNGDHACLYGVVTTFVNLCNAYDKQEIIPEMIELAKYAKHHIPEEHELDDPDFVSKRIEVLAKEGVTYALVELAKTDSKNSKELISRVLNAICSQQELRGIVVQQGGTKSLLSMALDGTLKGKIQAAQALARIGITINPEVAFPGQRCVEVVRPLLSLLDSDCSALENFEALMALCNVASVNETVRKRILKEGGLHKIEMYVFEEHTLLRRAATQVITNLIIEEEVIKAYEGDNDKAKMLYLSCLEDDVETVQAASGALARATSVSRNICGKLFKLKQWPEILQAILAYPDKGVQHRGIVVVNNILSADVEFAAQIIETNIMELLMALSKVEDADLAPLAEKALNIAESHKLIQRNRNVEDQVAPSPAPTEVIQEDVEMPELE